MLLKPWPTPAGDGEELEVTDESRTPPHVPRRLSSPTAPALILPAGTGVSL